MRVFLTPVNFTPLRVIFTPGSDSFGIGTRRMMQNFSTLPSTFTFCFPCVYSTSSSAGSGASFFFFFFFFLLGSTIRQLQTFWPPLGGTIPPGSGAIGRGRGSGRGDGDGSGIGKGIGKGSAMRLGSLPTRTVSSIVPFRFLLDGNGEVFGFIGNGAGKKSTGRPIRFGVPNGRGLSGSLDRGAVTVTVPSGGAVNSGSPGLPLGSSGGFRPGNFSPNSFGSSGWSPIGEGNSESGAKRNRKPNRLRLPLPPLGRSRFALTITSPSVGSLEGFLSSSANGLAGGGVRTGRLSSSSSGVPGSGGGGGRVGPGVGLGTLGIPATGGVGVGLDPPLPPPAMFPPWPPPNLGSPPVPPIGDDPKPKGLVSLGVGALLSLRLKLTTAAFTGASGQVTCGT